MRNPSLGTAIHQASFIIVLTTLGCSKDEAPASPPASPAEATQAVSAPAPAERASPAPAEPGTTPEAGAEQAPPPPAPPSAKLAANSQCAGICVRTNELHCSQASNCERLCHNTLAGAPCSSEMASAIACMLRYPASDWACTPDGLAAIKEGLCDAEQDVLTACVTKMVGGSP